MAGEESRVAQISAGWLPREGLLQGDFACGGVSLVRTPNHTRCVVATGPTVGGGTQNDLRSLTLEDCKVITNKRVTYILSELYMKIGKI